MLFYDCWDHGMLGRKNKYLAETCLADIFKLHKREKSADQIWLSYISENNAYISEKHTNFFCHTYIFENK